MANLGPFIIGEPGRIGLEVLLNGVPTEVGNPRIEKIFGPDGTELPGYPKLMVQAKFAVYYMEDTFNVVGNYSAIIQAEYGSTTIEQLAEFIVNTRQFGYPKIEVACDE